MGVFIVLALCLNVVQSQHLPFRDEELFQFHINREEIFYDTKVLPDGAQMQAYLLRDQETRFFFIVEEDGVPLQIKVTPCSPNVSWSIAYRPPFEEGSADARFAGDDDLFIDQEVSQPLQDEQDVILANFTSSTEHTFAEESSSSGMYTVLVSSEGGDSSVLLYASTSPSSDHLFPQLPSDPRVRVLATSDSSFTFAWKAVADEEHRIGDGRVGYCVAVNQQQHFVSQCDASTFTFGDEAPTPPPNAGFGFAWEEERTAKFLSDAQPRVASNDAFLTCVESKTQFTFTGAEPQQAYFIDVFAVDRLTNGSVAYVGSNVVTAASRNVMIPLESDQVHVDVLEQPRRVFRYVLNKQTNSLLVIVAPSCAEPLKVKISDSQRTLRSVKIRSLTHFEITPASIGEYFLQVTLDRGRPGSYRIWASPDPSRNPFPDLPADTQVRVRDETCGTVSVSWHVANKRQQYCLYVYQQNHSRARTERHCTRPPRKKKPTRTLCRSFRPKRRRGQIMTETLSGLRPNTTYAFEVHVQRPRGGESMQMTPAQASISCRH
ncbi:hypothetical protein CAPTEDRAFT_98130 [Capitella teleta]|uniref:Protein NDNF n=1 Tax=Capitella teleta TaxID=283909 RepID=R7UUY9_CAPTE|nr:hypothetical protein CAPTEDRAFT_98130 [Capitella teleta]|eukprot:ELU07201.1 hypothetical protein CAPTEDRAFT_98130 [Capitella teleta]